MTEPDRWSAFRRTPADEAALKSLCEWLKNPSEAARDQVAEWARTVFARLSLLANLTPLLLKLEGDVCAKSVRRRVTVG